MPGSNWCLLVARIRQKEESMRWRVYSFGLGFCLLLSSVSEGAFQTSLDAGRRLSEGARSWSTKENFISLLKQCSRLPAEDFARAMDFRDSNGQTVIAKILGKKSNDGYYAWPRLRAIFEQRQDFCASIDDFEAIVREGILGYTKEAPALSVVYEQMRRDCMGIAATLPGQTNVFHILARFGSEEQVLAAIRSPRFSPMRVDGEGSILGELVAKRGMWQAVEAYLDHPYFKKEDRLTRKVRAQVLGVTTTSPEQQTAPSLDFLRTHAESGGKLGANHVSALIDGRPYRRYADASAEDKAENHELNRFLFQLLKAGQFGPNERFGKSQLTIPMMLAVYGPEDLARQAVSFRDLDPNVQDADGWTIGALAGRYGFAKVALAILDHPKFDPSLTTNKGTRVGELCFCNPALRSKLVQHPRFDFGAKGAGSTTAEHLAQRNRLHSLGQHLEKLRPYLPQVMSVLSQTDHFESLAAVSVLGECFNPKEIGLFVDRRPDKRRLAEADAKKNQSFGEFLYQQLKHSCFKPQDRLGSDNLLATALVLGFAPVSRLAGLLEELDSKLDWSTSLGVEGSLAMILARRDDAATLKLLERQEWGELEPERDSDGKSFGDLLIEKRSPEVVNRYLRQRLELLVESEERAVVNRGELRLFYPLLLALRRKLPERAERLDQMIVQSKLNAVEKWEWHTILSWAPKLRNPASFPKVRVRMKEKADAGTFLDDAKILVRRGFHASLGLYLHLHRTSVAELPGWREVGPEFLELCKSSGLSEEPALAPALGSIRRSAGLDP